MTAPATEWKDLTAWAVTNFPAKPFTVSETGGGGVYEWVNSSAPFPGPFWSQAFQANLVLADATYLMGDARVSAFSLWL